MFFLLKHRFEAKEYSLPVNYRSNALILGAANRFLQFGSQIRASREKGEKIEIVNYYDPFQEAEELALRIRAGTDISGDGGILSVTASGGCACKSV